MGVRTIDLRDGKAMPVAEHTDEVEEGIAFYQVASRSVSASTVTAVR